MKANESPDKIHVQPNAHDRWFEGSIPNGLPNGLFVEYVRKDALLEWAKIKQTQCLEDSMAHVYFQMFIDKLNCM